MSGPLVACLLGWSNTGKTTLAERTLALLASRGVPCAALKVTRHPGGFNIPGKDTSRFLAAGAEAAILGGGELVLSLRRAAPPDRALLERLFPDARVILVEGARIEGAPALLAAGGAASPADLKVPLAEVDAVATSDAGLAAEARAAGVAAIDPLDPEKLVEYLEAWYGRNVEA
jgi:molybdopterin-guanine dinucleotide biosynthesis protein MobB